MRKDQSRHVQTNTQTKRLAPHKITTNEDMTRYNRRACEGLPWVRLADDAGVYRLVSGTGGERYVVLPVHILNIKHNNSTA